MTTTDNRDIILNTLFNKNNLENLTTHQVDILKNFFQIYLPRVNISIEALIEKHPNLTVTEIFKLYMFHNLEYDGRTKTNVVIIILVGFLTKTK